MSPKKRNTLKRYRPLFLLLAFVLILILLITFLVKSCGDHTDDDNSDTLDIADDTHDNDDEEENKDTNDGMIYIPVERETVNNSVNESPLPSGINEEDLEAAKLVITQDLGAEYIEKFHFLCDSPLYGLKTLGMLSDGIDTDRVISGISSSFSLLFGEEALVYDTVTDSVMTVAEKIKKVSPEYLLISVGADDIKTHSGMSYSLFKASYSELITAVKNASPKSTVICMPILPGSSGDGLSVYAAERYNVYIHEAAAECGVYYIDIASAFASSGGHLRIDCDGGTSRLNTTGLKRLLELLRSYTVPSLTE